jgi:hypothetical protein
MSTPLPALAPRDLHRRRILHEIEERHGARAVEPRLDVLDRDAHVVSNPPSGGERVRAVVAAMQEIRPDCSQRRARCATKSSAAGVSTRSSPGDAQPADLECTHDASCASPAAEQPAARRAAGGARSPTSASIVNAARPSVGRVGHRRDTGRHRGVAVSGPSSGRRRRLVPWRSSFPVSPSITPDGGLFPVRLEAKAYPRGAFPTPHATQAMARICRVRCGLLLASSDRCSRGLPSTESRPFAPDRTAFAQGSFAPEALPSFRATTSPCADPRASHLPFVSLPLAPPTAGRGDHPALGLPFYPGVPRPLRRRLVECS